MYLIIGVYNTKTEPYVCAINVNFYAESRAESEKPTARELSIFIKPHAQQWFEIGILLGIPLKKLQDIEKHHTIDVESCGANMLMEWLVCDPNACWKKLRETVDKTSKIPNINSSTESGTSIITICTHVDH